MFIVRTRETRETTRKRPANTVKPLTRTRRTPTRKTWGRGLTGTGTGWPGIPQGYPWYSLESGLIVTGVNKRDPLQAICIYLVINSHTQLVSPSSQALKKISTVYPYLFPCHPPWRKVKDSNKIQNTKYNFFSHLHCLGD